MKNFKKINNLPSNVGYKGDRNDFKKNVLNKRSSQDLETILGGNCFGKILLSYIAVLGLSVTTTTSLASAMVSGAPIPIEVNREGNDLFENNDFNTNDFLRYESDSYYFVHFLGSDGHSLKSKSLDITSFKNFRDHIKYLVNHYGYEVFNESISIDFPLNIKAFFNIIEKNFDKMDRILSEDRLDTIHNLKLFICYSKRNKELIELASYIIETIKYD